MKLINLQKTWKRHAVLLDIHDEGFNTKISQCLGVNLSTMQTIRKKLDESNGDYKEIAEKFAGDFKVIWKLWSNPLMISLNKFDL